MQDAVVIQEQQSIIGFLKIVPKTKNLYLGEIQIKNLYQNQGIGTKILQSVIEQNQFKYQSIWLQVLKGNPAIRLYQSLGFKIFAETKTHYKMQLI
ncbi:GCN5-related N-acetyltransferase (fragment) [Hyella patelloides LEGE 07179]|uniref:GCN5-related N-acetyltransferase n=1 Tax=Hyella patelloides LEGE 07179 TaxID=945734 RepID=A0A563VXX9_9CYAN